MLNRILVGVMVVAAVLAITACGDDDEETGGTATLTPAPSATSELRHISSEEFNPALSLDAGSGWTAVVDTGGVFVLEHEQDASGPHGGIVISRPLAVYAVDGIQQEPVPADLVTWMESHPRLVIRDRQDIVVGGRSGVRLDVESDQEASWRLFENSDGTFEVRYSDRIRFEILDGPGGQIVLSVDAADQPLRLEQVLAIAEPIVESIEFAQ